MQEQWAAVDRYINESIVHADDALDAALRSSEQAGLPPINVTAAQGKLLHLLARMRGARRILEIGTLGGYSTIWLARALPAGGRLVTLELEPKHADVARANFVRAGVAPLIDLRVGRASDALAQLIAERAEPFDLTFIDADKESMADYFGAALKLSRAGSVIVADNVVRKGAVVDAASTDASVQGVRRFNALLARQTNVSATTIQTVGSKGYDGFTLALMLAAQ